MIETSQTTNTNTFKIEPDDQGGRMRTVTINRHNVLPAPKKRKGKNPPSTSHILIGFDTEYQSDHEAEKENTLEQGARNKLLSYQFNIKLVSQDDGSGPQPETEGIIIPNDQPRIGLETFICIAIGSLIDRYPDIKLPQDIYLVGHFTRADMPAFHDFREKAKALLANVRGTFMSLDSAIKLPLRDSEGEFAELQVRVRDTFLLAPGNAKSLADIGKIVGFDKLVLDADPKRELEIKENMEQFRRENWQAFREYAIRDAQVCVRYAEQVIRQHYDLFQEFKMPATLTGFGTKLAIEEWEKQGIKPHDVLGRETVKDRKFVKRWRKKEGTLISYYEPRTTAPFREELFFEIPFVTECYHGGRNEQFLFGIADEGEWRDHDLSSAYPTAMTMIGFPDWDSIKRIDTFEGIDPCDLAYFSVDFEFPESVRFPTLPVRTPNGIIFPRKGRSKCAAPELFLATQLQAKIKIRRGLLVKSDRSKPVFADFIKKTIQKRIEYEPKTFHNLFWKEVGNSTYGKTAQGLREKRVYDLRSDDMKEIPESEITQPFFAAFITSFTRALLGEILNGFTPATTVFSVTTDGFLSNATDAEIHRATQGQLFATFAVRRRELVPDAVPLEIKHEVRQPIGWRTRGSATLKPGPAENGIVLQKGGLKAREMVLMTTEQENQFVIDKFFSRHPGKTVEYTSGAGLKDMIRLDTDFVFRKTTKRLSMEFDWKRRPTNVRDATCTFMGEVRHHLSFDSEPLKDADEFNRTRDAWEKYNKNPLRNLKTVSDLNGFQLYVETNVDKSHEVTKYLSKTEGDLKRLRRDLTRAFKQGEAGFDVVRTARTITDKQFCQSLVDCGIPCDVYAVENGRKTVFTRHTTLPTQRVLQALAKLKRDHYPLLEIEVLLSEEPTQNPQQSDAKLAA